MKITRTGICDSDLPRLPPHEAPEAYKYFDHRDEGCTKVVLKAA